jgi:hypothetical protein
MVASIRQHGVQHPILVDRNGIIWDGRRRHAACLELDVTPAFRVIDDGPMAALAGLHARQMTVLERADLLEHLRTQHREKFSRCDGERESERFSCWLKQQFGWAKGYSWKNIDGYRRLALASPCERAMIAECGSDNLHQALRCLSGQACRGEKTVLVKENHTHIEAVRLGCQFLSVLDTCSGVSEALHAVLKQIQCKANQLRRANTQ